MSAIAWMAQQPDIQARVLHQQTARNRQAFVHRAPRTSRDERIAWVLAYLDAHGPTALAELRIAAGMSIQGMRNVIDEAVRRKAVRLHWHGHRVGARMAMRWGLTAALPHAHPDAVAAEVERAYKSASIRMVRPADPGVAERRVAQLVAIVHERGAVGVQAVADAMRCDHGRAKRFARMAQDKGLIDFRRDGPPKNGRPTMMLYAKGAKP